MQQDDVTTETLASNIRDARHALGWSVDKLADKADLPVDHVRRLERGGGCSGPDLAQLSRALGIPAHVLVPDHEHSNADDLKPRLPVSAFNPCHCPGSAHHAVGQ